MTPMEQLKAMVAGKKVAFIGAGVSHKPCITMLAALGADITLCDQKKSLDDFGDYADTLRKLNVKLSLGEHYTDGFAGQDIIMRTPGYEFFKPELQAAKQAGALVTSEVELFFELCPCEIVAVTGSDGKTTTTTLIAKMFEAAGRKVFLGGNIGAALLPQLPDVTPADIAVVELSSFQLLSMRQSPDVAVITNIAPNHLDVHGTMEEYIYAKTNLIAHQDAFSRTILNLDNEPTMHLASMVRGTLTTFSRRTKPEFGTYLREDGMLCFTKDGKDTPVVHMNDIRIPGMHNVENYLAAINAVWGTVSVEDIQYVAKNFGGVEHRIEFVRELDGVKWYNDSIATSPTRVLAGLRSFQQKLIVIMGGYDKKIPFEPMADTVCKQVKLVLLMADKIEAAIRGSQFYQEGAPELVHVGSMEEAVQEARKRAKTGDIVTLSPACASFDLYPNFEARGIHYKNLVKELH